MTETERESNETPRAGRWRAHRFRWLLLGLALLAMLISLSKSRVERYVTSDPRFCSSCHVASTSAAHASAHKNQPCSSCHQSDFGANARQWLLARVSNARVEHGKFEPASCKGCHAKGGSERWQIGRTRGHVEHVLEAKKPLACKACHELSKHGSAPKPEACSSCHTEVRLFDHLGSQMPDAKPAPCVSCHDYLAPTDTAAPAPSTDCKRCHGGEQLASRNSRFAVTLAGAVVSPEAIHGNLKTCSLCHNPHREKPEERNVATDCWLCHVQVKSEHHQQRLPDKFDCSSCHAVHGPRADLSAKCSRCHEQTKEPELTLAKQHQRCSQCHEAHDFVATVSGCRTCHEAETTTLASWQPKTHADCKTCHVPHETRQETALCADCHRPQAAHAHPKCTTCHDPHQERTHVKACSECHQQEFASIQSPGAPHQAGCATCHQPHAPKSAVQSCRTCHAGEVLKVQTAKIEQHRDCKSCHEPHGFRASQATCKGCHQIPEAGSHSGPCLSCHQPHGAPLGRAATCSNCHEKVHKAEGKHADCQSCHANAHAPTKASPVCTECHTPQAAQVSAWSAKTPHKECKSCHESHAPTHPKACADCHTQQRAELKVPGHRCSSCHETHQAPLELWSSCKNCHAKIVASASTRAPPHAECKSCHAPHQGANAVPACSSCHQSLPLAHTIKGHQRCADCHTAHSAAAPTRAACLKCHTGKANHFPEASSCGSCHLFK